MFSIFRFILIVGVIFYYSPVREQVAGPLSLDSWLAPKTEAPAAPEPTAQAGHLEKVWQALPDGAKQAVIDKILTTSGFPAPPAKGTDTLQAQDRQPQWRGEAAKPRT